MDTLFLEIGLVLLSATALGVLARILKQPLVIAYIFAGLLLALIGVIRPEHKDFFALLGEIGVTFLLFLVGIELSVRQLKSVGKVSLYTGLGQMAFSTLTGLLIALVLGFNLVVSIYLALALAFSSTIIVVKLLSEKNETNSLHGRVAIGFLLVQDFVALLILIFLSGFESGQSVNIFTFPWILVKGVFLLYLTLLFSKRLIPPIFTRFAHNNELLFLGALTWCFMWASLARYLGFSVEIGSFLAGLALATSAHNWQISAKIRPLRDLFIVIFFVVLGLSINLGEIANYVVPVILFSVLVLVGKSLIVMFIMRNMDFRNRTSFLTSITVGQVSEFSLIIVALGVKLGHLGTDIVALVTLVGLITISVSSYAISNARRLYYRLSPLLKNFEKVGAHGLTPIGNEVLKDHIVLVGCRRMGNSLLKAFSTAELNFVVLDFDPEIVKRLEERGLKAFFGDASDPEVLEHLSLEHAKMVVSTIEKLEENLALLKDSKILNPKIMVILTAQEEKDALALYAQGADYVVIPHISGGEHLANIILGKVEDKKDLRKVRQREIEHLQERVLDHYL
ncbi:MAG: hypothetical protein A3F33_01045 [Candidatus Woykebacteria bacterium RIFCSPHIGHO2_12_FULL_43_10]|uniref:RCK N-terminal domain-containing protein n=2 Tax=Candidatus Woykeibacteriota TaxID=1817899 RepID=A0A1G1WW72_9BACT|nr:MAG: hypothetical protein A2802_00690 [Candidatus Woykebacteria bacterium RIFCSPHIGHO2_01_FULL_43_29]OGY29192.1 MAG: hypothetical protein A3F33_01045 [Candidatus Woykebacteria bacterium RIFCSPHIGHO2_12_FULL_43_10]OGY30005.1 MAG: hypothetical protein A3J50_02895 [Candidatus Woykebacteria bacterium RIFCSPHIGHO2_02_FULL_43_16b]OGY32006.1 MAG: hypothetical protein A3A61_01140 [Candidatus Woykebacteria bacterium RIFCSPLOWO2_01_FULL_43_14]